MPICVIAFFILLRYIINCKSWFIINLFSNYNITAGIFAIQTQQLTKDLQFVNLRFLKPLFCFPNFASFAFLSVPIAVLPLFYLFFVVLMTPPLLFYINEDEIKMNNSLIQWKRARGKSQFQASVFHPNILHWNENYNNGKESWLPFRNLEINFSR
jgi:hypothetical protein